MSDMFQVLVPLFLPILFSPLRCRRPDFGCCRLVSSSFWSRDMASQLRPQIPKMIWRREEARPWACILRWSTGHGPKAPLSRFGAHIQFGLPLLSRGLLRAFWSTFKMPRMRRMAGSAARRVPCMQSSAREPAEVTCANASARCVMVVRGSKTSAFGPRNCRRAFFGPVSAPRWT